MTRFVIVGAMLAFAAAFSGARAQGASAWMAEQTDRLVKVEGQYSNRQYGFRLSIPAGVSAWRTAPPNPDHGVMLILGEHRTIDVSAAYDAALYGSTAALMERRVRDAGGGPVKRFTVQLGGAPAEEAVVGGAAPETIVAQWRAVTPENAINYSVVLVTTPAERKADGAVLVALLAGYHHMAPEQ